mmetsp:Transcript_38408/g.66294  ORF Transcript_38408/g.66294 Transcript_38408/m.66294 type:complete len:597 (-) Transcript_38408:1627-3417(-)
MRPTNREIPLAPGLGRLVEVLVLAERVEQRVHLRIRVAVAFHLHTRTGDTHAVQNLFHHGARDHFAGRRGGADRAGAGVVLAVQVVRHAKVVVQINVHQVAHRSTDRSGHGLRNVLALAHTKAARSLQVAHHHQRAVRHKATTRQGLLHGVRVHHEQRPHRAGLVHKVTVRVLNNVQRVALLVGELELLAVLVYLVGGGGLFATHQALSALAVRLLFEIFVLEGLAILGFFFLPCGTLFGIFVAVGTTTGVTVTAASTWNNLCVTVKVVVRAHTGQVELVFTALLLICAVLVVVRVAAVQTQRVLADGLLEVLQGLVGASLGLGDQRFAGLAVNAARSLLELLDVARTAPHGQVLVVLIAGHRADLLKVLGILSLAFHLQVIREQTGSGIVLQLGICVVEQIRDLLHRSLGEVLTTKHQPDRIHLIFLLGDLLRGLRHPEAGLANAVLLALAQGRALRELCLAGDNSRVSCLVVRNFSRGLGLELLEFLLVQAIVATHISELVQLSDEGVLGHLITSGGIQVHEILQQNRQIQSVHSCIRLVSVGSDFIVSGVSLAQQRAVSLRLDVLSIDLHRLEGLQARCDIVVATELQQCTAV